MLLNLLAIISSTALLVSAICEIAEQHTGWQGFVAGFLALILAAVNFFGVRRAGLALANMTSDKTEAVQAQFGKAFSLVILIWAVCAGILGSWMARLVLSQL